MLDFYLSLESCRHRLISCLARLGPQIPRAEFLTPDFSMRRECWDTVLFPRHPLQVPFLTPSFPPSSPLVLLGPSVAHAYRTLLFSDKDLKVFDLNSPGIVIFE